MVEFTKGSMSPISDGTGIFIAAVAMVIIWSWALARGHYVPKDCFLITRVIVITLGVATWLMWVCAWMHQWHPLIVPTWKETEKATDVSANGRRF